MDMRKNFGRRCGMLLGLVAASCAVSDVRGQVIPVEMMYNHPQLEDLEYLELENRGAETVSLDGASFSDGITYVFGAVTLAPGERVLVAKDLDVFDREYLIDPTLTLVGGYDGRLSNGGETVALISASGETLFSFTYSDGGNWPSRADGGGSSLELLEGVTDVDQPESWRASRRYGGSPGDLAPEPDFSLVINEVLAHTDPPFQDAIEVKNLGETPVDLSGWFVSDSLSQFDRYIVPPGVTVAPGAYHVFYEQELNFTNPGVPFSLNSAMGDQVVIVSADAGGFPTFFVDAVQFGSSANGIPFGRSPDGTGPFVTLEGPTFGSDVVATDPPERVSQFIRGEGAPNRDPLVGPVVVSKILYEPEPGKSEFVELTNLTPFEFPLFDPMAPTNHWRLSEAITFDFPANTRLPANGRVIVSGTTPELFQEQYPELEADLILGPFTGSLNNGGERIDLIRPDFPLAPPDPDAGFVPLILAEQVRYDDDLPWPQGADGTGRFLVRTDLRVPGNDPTNWALNPVDPNGPGTDADADGIDDAWERANGLNPELAADALEDPDGDGFTNRDEFEANTNPQDAADRLEILEVQSSDGGANVTFRFEAKPEIAYAVLRLDPAALGGERVEVETFAPDPAGGERVVTVPVLDAGFYVVTAQRP